jgi:carbonic anhydrase
MLSRSFVALALVATLATGCFDGDSPSAAPRTETQEGHSFGYAGDVGPGFWGKLDPDWKACAGARQSPIDITATRPARALAPLRLSLHPSPTHLVNNGHTLEMEYHAGSSVQWHGTTYDLLQFHFHTPSEHTIAGRRYPMELHAVFKAPSTGRLLVIGQLFQPGASNPFLARFAAHLPAHSGGSWSGTGSIDVASELTGTSGYWTYAGSLTTPPCSPIVTWVVLKRIATASTGQLEAFWNVMGNNFRPTQAREGRAVESTS